MKYLPLIILPIALIGAYFAQPKDIPTGGPLSLTKEDAAILIAEKQEEYKAVHGEYYQIKNVEDAKEAAFFGGTLTLPNETEVHVCDGPDGKGYTVITYEVVSTGTTTERVRATKAGYGGCAVSGEYYFHRPL